MSLALLGGGTCFEFRWRRWALLRDCVLHHLQQDEEGARYEHFSSIGDALVEGTIRLPAEALAKELESIREELGALELSDLVMGPKTARVLSPKTPPLDEPRPLTDAERGGILPPGDSTNLAQYFDTFIGSALAVCRAAAEVGTFVEVSDQ